MAVNMIGMLKGLLTDNLIARIAELLGENKSGVTNAVGGALPTLLLGLLKKGSEPGGAENIIKILQEGKHDGGILDDLGGVLGGGDATTKLQSTGKDLLGSILGDNAGGIGDLIASASGISKQSGTSLLGMLAPIVMGFLGKTLKTQGGLNAASLTNLLASQKDFVKAALPAGAANLLGVSDLGDLGQQAMQGAAAAGAGMKMWQWIAAIVIAILVILLLWRSCGKQVPVQETLQDTSKSVQEAVQDTTQRVEEQVGGAMAALGKFFTKKLPSGVALNIPEFGVENKLIAFIEDANAPVDEKTWFTFDRLTFETGKATLKPESQEQLKNIAEIMKAYPKVSIKLGGYTDNVGDPQANLQLSKARAEAVMADLVTLGIDAKRLQAEGYGQEHPVADNSTEEGRAKNRRIDLRVTAK